VLDRCTVVCSCGSLPSAPAPLPGAGGAPGTFEHRLTPTHLHAQHAHAHTHTHTQALELLPAALEQRGPTSTQQLAAQVYFRLDRGQECAAAYDSLRDAGEVRRALLRAAECA
jgi:hypothetical protein